MEKEAFIALAQGASVSSAETRELRNVLAEFPYFQAAQALYLKGLKQNQSFSYNAELKRTAAYTTDRSILFDFITSEEFVQDKISAEIKSRTQEETEPSEAEAAETLPEEPSTKKEKYTEDYDQALRMNTEEANRVLDPALFSDSRLASKAEQKAGVGEPFDFKKEEAHSFAEWLKLTKQKPIDRSTTSAVEKSDEKEKHNPESREEQSRKSRLIDDFIAKKPKIPAPKENPSKTTFSNSESTDSQLMTETLARVYLEQKNYLKAIQAYKILILKNPEKSGFFADQIRSIEQIQENKNT